MQINKIIIILVALAVLAGGNAIAAKKDGVKDPNQPSGKKVEKQESKKADKQAGKKSDKQSKKDKAKIVALQRQVNAKETALRKEKKDDAKLVKEAKASETALKKEKKEDKLAFVKEANADEKSVAADKALELDGGISPLPVSYTAKFSTPDIVQTDPEGKLPKGGNSHCGPVSSSGTMMWLGANGYENLVTKLDNPKETQFRLAEVLGSADYMDATKSGTGADGVIKSLCKYIQEKGYKCRAHYQGWRDHPINCMEGELPQLDWIKKGVVGDSAVLINIGWNIYDANTDTYERHSGHWLSVVGYGVDENGKEDAGILVLRDSASRAGKEPGLEYARLEPIKSGMIVTGKGANQKAAGLNKVVGGMHIKKGYDCAILDNAVVIRLTK
jgi:hypothetical protein